MECNLSQVQEALYQRLEVISIIAMHRDAVEVGGKEAQVSDV